MININITLKDDKFSPVDPRRAKSIWPAIIFAVNRTARVRGRIISLILSIITIKGIKIEGVPWGVKCLITSLK